LNPDDIFSTSSGSGSGGRCQAICNLSNWLPLVSPGWALADSGPVRSGNLVDWNCTCLDGNLVVSIPQASIEALAYEPDV